MMFATVDLSLDIYLVAMFCDSVSYKEGSAGGKQYSYSNEYSCVDLPTSWLPLAVSQRDT